MSEKVLIDVNYLQGIATANAQGTPAEVKNIPMEMYLLHGVFGELDNCNGIAEKIITPETGGTYLKILGCSYLYKGNPELAKVRAMELPKGNISQLPREIVGRSIFYMAAMLLRFLFQRRKFVHDVHVLIDEINRKGVAYVGLPLIRFNPPTIEILRAMDIALKKEFKLPPMMDLTERDMNWGAHHVMYQPVELACVIMKSTLLGTLIMELDGAYRFPTQDILGEVNKQNALRSGYREAMRLFDLMLERQVNLTTMEGDWNPEDPNAWRHQAPVSTRTDGIPYKFRFLRKLARIGLLMSPRARRIMQTFFLELDTKKVGLDEADWYYCLRRNTHNYRGIPLPERLKELERIDREKGHYYVKFENEGKGLDIKLDLKQKNLKV